jgi:hypothetical protein
MDISVTHPCSSSYVAAAATQPGSAAKARAAVKEAKYGAAAESVGISFMPIIFETYGRPNADFHKWMVDVCKKKDKENKIVRNKEDSGKIFMFGNWWFQRLSVSLQVGNARVIQDRASRDAQALVPCSIQ